MIVVHFERTYDSHDCWGRYEAYKTTDVMEFPNVDSWLEYKKHNKVDFIALYEISSITKESDNV